MWKKWIFIAQFHFQDPDPAWRFESGSNRIRIRNTAFNKLKILCEARIGFVKTFQLIYSNTHLRIRETLPLKQLIIGELPSLSILAHTSMLWYLIYTYMAKSDHRTNIRRKCAHRGASARRERQTSFKIVTWTKQTWTKHYNTAPPDSGSVRHFHTQWNTLQTAWAHVFAHVFLPWHDPPQHLVN